MATQENDRNRMRMAHLAQRTEFEAEDMDHSQPYGTPERAAAEFATDQAELNQIMVKTFDSINRQLGSMAGDLEEMKDQRASIVEDVGTIKRRQNTMANDIGDVKGAHALAEVAKNTAVIAYDLGFEYVGEVSRLDLAKMAQKVLDMGFEQNEVGSFRRADLVIETNSAAGPVYLAVEVSFTADARDTDRALRNAGFLRAVTGHTAHAVIASVRNDHYVDGIIAKGKVHRYSIGEHSLHPD